MHHRRLEICPNFTVTTFARRWAVGADDTAFGGWVTFLEVGTQSSSSAERGEIRFQSELGRTDTNDTEKDNVVLPSVVRDVRRRVCGSR